MDNTIGTVVVALIIAAVIVLVARRWRDRPSDRGPFSTAMDARGSFAGMNTTMDEPRPAEGEDEALPHVKD